MSHSIFKKNELIKAQSEIISKSKELGFDTIEISKPELKEEVKNNLNNFLENNYHGEMDWLKKNQYRRESPKNLWADVKTIICLGVNYGPATDPLKSLEKKEFGNISVYARGQDYHKIIKKNLKEFGRWLSKRLDCDLKVFVDTAPVMEKNIAELAGLGWQGKHTNLVSKEFGSWLFLSEIFINIDLKEDFKEKDSCGTCKKCLEICPTNAFTDKYKLDARKCISYLTIEHKSQIPLEFRKKIGNRIYGCDDCLAICPWNKFAKESKEIKFSSEKNITDLTLSNLSSFNDEDFRNFFSGSPIKRIGRDRFLRNVLIAIGNSNNKELAKKALSNINDKSSLVRGAAIWAIRRLLNNSELKKIKENSLSKEKDLSVISEWKNEIN